MFLVGGLGSNTFLRKFLRQCLPPDVYVKQPLDRCPLLNLTYNSWSAVVRGAVMYGLNSKVVRERILRRHYGIATSVVWDQEKHPLERRWRDHLDGTWRVDVMRWYVAKVPLPSFPTDGRVNALKIIVKSKSFSSTILTMTKY